MILIFDFDGHLYSGEKVFENVYEWVNEHRREFFPNINDEQYKKVLNENPNMLKVVSGREIVAEIYKIKSKYPEYKISTKDFWDCQNRFIYDINLDNAHFADVDFLRVLTKLFNCYIVSNSSPTHIYYYMGKIGIDPNGFKKIFSNEFIEEDPSKKHYYLSIAKFENVSNEKIYVYGDSYGADLKPAEEIGSNVCHTTDSYQFKENVINTIKLELTKDSELKTVLIEKFNSHKKYYEDYIHNSEIANKRTSTKLKAEINIMSSLLHELNLQ